MSRGLLIQGIEDFNCQRYWEAHHSWETPWRTLEGAARQELQAFIQACAVLHHLSKGALSPASSLCRSALERLAELRKQRSTGQSGVLVPGLEVALQEVQRALEHPEQVALDQAVSGFRALRASLEKEH